MSRYQQFLDAKQVIRSHGDWTDAQVAEYLAIKDFDTAGMATIRQARKDLEAGDSTRPDIQS